MCFNVVLIVFYMLSMWFRGLVGPPAGFFEKKKRNKFNGLVGPPAGIFENRT